MQALDKVISPNEERNYFLESVLESCGHGYAKEALCIKEAQSRECNGI